MVGGKPTQQKVLHGISYWSDYLFFFSLYDTIIVSILLYVITFFAFGVTSLRVHSCVIFFALQSINRLGTCRDCVGFPHKIRFVGVELLHWAAIPLIDV